jgi:zinc protease
MKLIDEHPFGAGDLAARRYRLDNSLQVILVRDASAPLAAVQTWFRVGSRHEREGLTGIAHLFEHLMFNETESLKPGEFDRMLEAVGAETNAATWVDWTYYRENVPRQHLELVLRLEAERMAHLVVHEPQIASEREVVMNERRFRVDDDVDGFLSEELYRLAYKIHPYRWPTIGWMRDIQAITVEDARHFYRTYYSPNNATLVLVGDFDEQAACALVERHYGPLPPSNIPTEDYVIEPAQTGPRRATFGKPVASDRLQIGWRAAGLADAAHPAIEVLVELLAGGKSSRLERRLVIETEVAGAVHAHAPEFRDPGLIEVRVALQRARRAEEAEELIEEEIAKLTTRPIPEEELAKVKNRIEARHWHALRPQDGKAEALGHHHTTAGDYRHLFGQAARVRAVTAGDVQRAAGRYLAANQRSTVVATPPSRKRS